VRVSELPGLHVPRMAMWRARFTFEPLDPRADAKAIAELKTCRAVTQHRPRKRMVRAEPRECTGKEDCESPEMAKQARERPSDAP